MVSPLTNTHCDGSVHNARQKVVWNEYNLVVIISREGISQMRDARRLMPRTAAVAESGRRMRVLPGRFIQS
jgi:hypothetical protein